MKKNVKKSINLKIRYQTLRSKSAKLSAKSKFFKKIKKIILNNFN